MSNVKHSTPKSDQANKELFTKFEDQLKKLSANEKQLQALLKDQEEQMATVDKMVAEDFSAWQQFNAGNIQNFADQLKSEFGYELNQNELAMLKAGASLEVIRERLKRHNISFPDNASEFTMQVYDAVTSVIGRTLGAIDNKKVNEIVKKLGVLKKEEKAIDRIKSSQAERFSKISQNANKTAEQVAKIAKSIAENTRAIEAIYQRALEIRVAARPSPTAKQG